MPPKKCYICDTEIEDDCEFVELLDGKCIKQTCFAKVQDPNNPKMTQRLLRSKIELLKKGDMEGLAAMMSNEGPVRSKAPEDLDLNARMEAAQKKAEEMKKLDDEEKAKKEALLQAAREAEDKKHADMKAAKEKEEADVIAAEQAKHDKFKSKLVWTLAELQDPKMLAEYHVDLCAKNEKGENNKETLLTDEEFMTVFGMDKEKFEALAGWKKKDAKKKNQIF